MTYQEEFHRKVCSGNFPEFDGSLYQISSNLSLFPDKQQLWDDLRNLAIKGRPNIQWNAIFNLGYVYPHVPNKQKAWEDLTLFLSNEEFLMRWSASFALGLSFQYIPDKKRAWEILHKLSSDKDPFVREGAAFTFISAFQHIPDKETAWKDIRRLLQDQRAETRKYATLAIGPGLLYISDGQIFTELYKLVEDEDGSVRGYVANVLGFVLTHITEISTAPDKQEIWETFHKLTKDVDEKVRLEVASSLRHYFPGIPNRQQVWEDLNKLISDKNNRVRKEATYSLGRLFRYAPDKMQAWEKLHKLTNDDDPEVQSNAAYAIGIAFAHISNKKQALDDLDRLSSSKHTFVRRSVNHSLGSVSIFNACNSKSDEEYILELEKAIGFFEKSIEEVRGDNPSLFCLPFYRSFYTIINKNQGDEVETYLSEMKDAIVGSQRRKALYETVSKLADALREVQNLGNIDIAEKRKELDYYRKYCEQAEELMNYTEEASPIATEMMKKGLPILDRKLKSLLEEIQEKAKTACRESQGTETEEIACAVSREVQKWEISNPADMVEYIEDISYSLKGKVQCHPENEYLLRKIELMKNETDLTKKFQLLSYIIGEIPTIKVVPEDVVVENISSLQKSLEKNFEELSQQIYVSLKSGVTEELVITKGVQFGGSGAQFITTIPLKEIPSPKREEILGRIKGNVLKLADFPKEFGEKIKEYLTKAIK